jgi:hypothetical protein
MPPPFRAWAQQKRAEANQIRRVAAVISLTMHRDGLLKQAAALDREADELERKAED